MVKTCGQNVRKNLHSNSKNKKNVTAVHADKMCLYAFITHRRAHNFALCVLVCAYTQSRENKIVRKVFHQAFMLYNVKSTAHHYSFFILGKLVQL